MIPEVILVKACRTEFLQHIQFEHSGERFRATFALALFFLCSLRIKFVLWIICLKESRYFWLKSTGKYNRKTYARAGNNLPLKRKYGH